MASGRHSYSSSSLSSSSPSSLIKGRSRPLLLILVITVAFYIFSILFPSSSPPHSIGIHSLDAAAVDYSFVASLEKFLATKSGKRLSNNGVHHDDVSKLDDAKWEADTQRLHQEPTFPVSLPIRVYVYDMPKKFTVDLLSLFLNTYKDTSNLTSNGSPVHRLIEQHSVDYWLWADLIAPESERPLKNVVVRVDREEEADLFYIPFFTTISFFLLEKQQCKALYRVML